MIIGISFGHDATLSVLDNGKQIFSIAEERLSRNKGHFGFPFKAVEYVFKNKIVSPAEIEIVSLANGRFKKGKNQVLEISLSDDLPYFDFMNSDPPDGFEIKEPRFGRHLSATEVKERVRSRVLEIFSKYGAEPQISFEEHHECHAASSAYQFQSDEALFITLDGEGDWISGSVSNLENGKLQRLMEVPKSHSIGYVYSWVTKQLGYKISRHEGKLTGLAAYGSSEEGLKRLRKFFGVNQGKFEYKRGPLHVLLLSLFTKLGPKKKWLMRNHTRHLAQLLSDLSPEDQAASVQDFLEETVLDFISYWMQSSGKSDLCLAGGVFANVKLNQRLANLDSVKSIHIFPNMGDGGIALGAAILAEADKTGKLALASEFNNVYWGPSFTDKEIKLELERHGDQLNVSKPKNISSLVAKHINNGLVIGWFQGGMEYGPRALGNRSIVAEPKKRELNDELNRRLSRTEFMPFAPSALHEKTEQVFILPDCKTKNTAQFMTITYDVVEDWSDKIGAVVHVDNTARPQLVTKSANPKYHRLIEEYEKLSGIPLVVNTSFNVHEEPIVCHPSEAIKALRSGVIDGLALGNFYVELVR